MNNCKRLNEEVDDHTHIKTYPHWISLDKKGLLKRRLYDKRDNLNFDIVIYLNSSILKCPAYGIYISHLVTFAIS